MDLSVIAVFFQIGAVASPAPGGSGRRRVHVPVQLLRGVQSAHGLHDGRQALKHGCAGVGGAGVGGVAHGAALVAVYQPRHGGDVLQNCKLCLQLCKLIDLLVYFPIKQIL